MKETSFLQGTVEISEPLALDVQGLKYSEFIAVDNCKQQNLNHQFAWIWPKMYNKG